MSGGEHRRHARARVEEDGRAGGPGGLEGREDCPGRELVEGEAVDEDGLCRREDVEG